MKVNKVNVFDLKSADYNPRQISKKDFEQLKKSLKTFDCVEPIVVNSYEGRENIVVGGHQRLRAMIELGWSEAPCVFVSLPLQEEKELNVRLNKNNGDWDFDILANEFEQFDLEEWGFDNLPKIEVDLDEPPEKPKTHKECPQCGHMWS